jgi:hypothetical protein
MSTSPPSVGNRYRLNPLDYNVNSTAYNTGYIEIGAVEPSLGLPTGYSLFESNSSYYFPVFGIANSYLNSRKFSGNDSLIIRNKKLGINNPNPTYNVDISGNLRASDAYITNLNASNLYGNDTLVVNYAKGVSFNSDVYFNATTYTNKLTANNITTFSLNAGIFNYITKNVSTYILNSLYATNDVSITANLTANNVYSSNKLTTQNLSSNNSFIGQVSSTKITVNNDVNVKNDIYANNFYGKIAIDESSPLYYNNQNQLSVSTNKNYYFVIRPSDSYSTDDINIARTINGPTDGVSTDSNTLKPYFKNIQPVIDYIYTNGIFGNNLTIWVDEDIVAGENKANAWTSDSSGSYSGCSYTGNISSAFYSSEYLQAVYPDLYYSGIKGGDFIWPKNNSADISGEYFYINLYPLKFNNINIQGRYELGTYVNNDLTKYYSTWRPFNFAPRKITCRTYICSNSAVPFNNFYGTDYNTWTDVYTKSSVIGRPIQFNQSQLVNLSINNLCFEIYTNSIDSSGLVFYNGNNNLSNITVALLGNGIYTYGALNVESELATINICGNNLLDPYYLTTNIYGNKNWNTWSTGYGFNDPNYYPGYGLAIVGNPADQTGTIVNYTEAQPYTGLINVRDGGKLTLIDYSAASREIGHYSLIQSSIILDGNFYANCLFNLDNRSSVSLQQNLFKTTGFGLSSKYIIYNNKNTNASYQIEISNYNLNFKYLNFNGSFASFTPISNIFASWSFRLQDSVQGTNYNTYLNVYNNVYDSYYTFFDTHAPSYISLTNSVNSLGHINFLQNSNFNTNDKIYYTSIYGIKNFNEYGIFNLNSPTNQTNTNYTLNFYTQSTR